MLYICMCVLYMQSNSMHRDCHKFPTSPTIPPLPEKGFTEPFVYSACTYTIYIVCVHAEYTIRYSTFVLYLIVRDTCVCTYIRECFYTSLHKDDKVV